MRKYGIVTIFFTIISDTLLSRGYVNHDTVIEGYEGKCTNYERAGKTGYPEKLIKRCLCIIAILCFLVRLFSACGIKQELSGTTDENRSSDGGPVANTNVVQLFDSLHEFEVFEKKQREGMTVYYLPAMPQEQYRLSAITKLEGIYFTTRYQFTDDIKASAVISNYGKEQLQYISCTQYLFTEPDGVIEMYRNNGFQEICYGDRIYFFKEERDVQYNNALLGYEILFVVEHTAIYMYLPAVGSFEEVLNYTNVEKHLIDR